MQQSGSMLTAVIAALALLATSAWAGDPEDGPVEIVIGNDRYAAGESVAIEQVAGDGDVLAAGGRVVLSASVPAAVYLAGGQVSVRGTVGGDALLAGGSVEVEGAVGDDVRAAGGVVTLSNRIGGDLVAAGGEIELLESAAIGGEAALAGGRVVVRGRLAGKLSIHGEEVVLDGAAQGPVNVTAESLLEIGPRARIAGDLTYRSPHPAMIDPGAVLSGDLRHLPLEVEPVGAPGWPAALGAGIVGLLGAWLAAAVVWTLFPTFAGAALARIAERPWQTPVLGFALLVTVPAGAMVLMATIIGAPLGAFVLVLLYPVALIGGWWLAAVRVGTWGLGLFGDPAAAGAGARWLFLLLAVLLLVFATAIPYLGGLVWLAATCYGLGALATETWRRYRGTAIRGRRAWA